jgi:hypothetical protein
LTVVWTARHASRHPASQSISGIRTSHPLCENRGSDLDFCGFTPAKETGITIGAGLGAEGFNLTVDAGCVRRLGLDFTRYARICLQTDTWLRELRAAQQTPVCA